MADIPDDTFSLLDDKHPHYTAVGLVASLWALLESTIDGAIAYLANTDEQSMACVTAQLIGPARRMDALIALFLHREGSEALRKELKNFQGRAQQLGEDRNRVIHDALVKGKTTGTIYKSLITAKGQLQYGFVPVDIKEIEKVASDIRAIIGEFIDLNTKITAEMNHILAQRLKRLGVIPDDQSPPSENPSESAQ
jgi:hypothetical protein